MKKLLFLLSIIAVTMVSCKKFLNTEPIDKISIKQYYTDEDGLTQALAGVYDPLGAYYGNDVIKNHNGCTDEGYYARNNTTGLPTNSYDASNDGVAALWTMCYRGIDRANTLIANINLPQMDETKRQIILGEALFLRGYYHFLLVQYYGNVPIKLEPTTNPADVFVSQSPAKVVYEQVLKDMKEAETKVSTSTALGFSGRVSKTVVEGILARVCLQMAGYPLNDNSKYAEALNWAKKVQSSGEHALKTSINPDPAWTYNAYTATNPSVKQTLATAYSQIFINEAQDVYDTKESMWEIEFNGDRSGVYNELGGLGSQNGITMTATPFQGTIGYSYGFIRGTARLYKAYGAGDLRRDWVLTTFTYNGTTGVETAITGATGYGRDCAKWRRIYEISKIKDKNQTAINAPVLRFADVLLMLAEAENQVNGPTEIAYKAVNQVRRRGYGLDINTISPVADLPAGLSKSQFQQAIEDERFRELCFEGTRRLDLIRWGKYVSTLNSVGNEIKTGYSAQTWGGTGGMNTVDKHLLYPIPLKEMGINTNLKTQNPDW
ncbi:RagB/SusD family nutrient uptake outer membrane protein [Pedobacter nyackensis]|uniref:Starch-binding associating with outer membrane n=1 Tax=Pedobacter nyackensis TaxID=475255 RepID=A0A1W2EU33_9SPHI|nr:RagB/SusD family nutrient uptake outer membrane protein [Pedobacter nyackensis]SMD13217.1 Starch-binding associating with outer membrane [Pedobacter nyackensis]